MSEKSTYRNEILIKGKIKELVRGIKQKKSTILQQSTSFFILAEKEGLEPSRRLPDLRP